MSATTALTAETPTAARRAIRGGVVGNFVDQFDIFVPVVALAPAALTLYGPTATSTSVALVFVATLLGRPLGAAIFGHLADRWGRAATTQVAVAGVALTTGLIAVVPGHESIGGATILLILGLRFLGGVFIGGQYSSAIPLAMEWARPHRRGLVSGLIMAMSPLANASIAGLTLVGLVVLGPDAYAAWGWRVIFSLGAVLAAAMAAYYRWGVRDSDASGRAPAGRRSPVVEVLVGAHRRQLWQVFTLTSGLWLFTNLAIPVLTAQLKGAETLGDERISAIMLVATAVSAVTMAAAGHASTLLGRRRFLCLFGAVALVGAPWCFGLATRATGPLAAGAAVVALHVVTVSAYGPIGAYLAERFPPQVRATGYGVGYSLSMVVPALYPFYLPALQALLGPSVAVAGLLGLGALLVLVGSALGPEPYRGQRL